MSMSGKIKKRKERATSHHQKSNSLLMITPGGDYSSSDSDSRDSYICWYDAEAHHVGHEQEEGAREDDNKDDAPRQESSRNQLNWEQALASPERC
jgi:hypothetical protein